MAGRKRLTGRNGKVYQATKGEIITGNGETVLTKGKFYIPLTIAATGSGFPENTQVGIVLVGDGTFAPTETETYIELTLTSQCDIRSGSVEFSNDEIDITTLCDDLMTYAPGFTDATGSLEGITTLNLSEPMIAKFVTVQKQDATGAITVIDKNDDPLVLVLNINKTDNSEADYAAFFAPITLNGYNLGVQINEAQTFTSNFRIAQDNELKPCLIEADKALFTAGA